MTPPKRVGHLLVPRWSPQPWGLLSYSTSLKGTVEPVLGWSLAVLLYALAIAPTVTLVRLVIRAAPMRRNGPGTDPRSDRYT